MTKRRENPGVITAARPRTVESLSKTFLALCALFRNYTCVHESFLAALPSPARGASAVAANTILVSSVGVRGLAFSNALDYPAAGTKDARGNDFDPAQPTLSAALKRLFRSVALINSRTAVPASVKRAQLLRRYMPFCRVGNNGARTRVDYHEEEYRW